MIKGVVLDAPFSDCYTTLQYIVQQNGINSLISSVALFMFKQSIKGATGYDVIGNNNPMDKSEIISTPVILMLGDKDEMISQEKIMKMFIDWNGDSKKYRVLENTDHSDCRED